MQQLAKYANGNTTVTIFDDGTKVREYDGEPFVVHPESIDVKITDYCDMACAYCHESSTKKGLHGDLNQLLEVISALPAGVELAIGGGNPLSHPDLVDFLQKVKDQGLIANITVNQGHLKRYRQLLESLIKDGLVKGVGVSIIKDNLDDIAPFLLLTKNIVYHLIAGVSKIEIVDKLIQLDDAKILLLGFKRFGFGVNYYNSNVDNSLRAWRKYLPKLISKCTLSFDNLAVEQLNVKRLLTDEGWDKFYMGDDFCFTMYIDAVKQEFAPTSRSLRRQSFSERSLLEYFGNH